MDPSVSPRGCLALVLFTSFVSAQAPTLIDIGPGAFSSRPDGFTPFGYRSLFVAQTLSAGRELFVTDGTVEGTRLFADVANPGSSNPTSLTPLDAERVLFVARDRTGMALWVSDGTPERTVPLYRSHLQPTASGTIATLAGTGFFAGYDSDHGSELWITDGTSAGTKRLIDLRRGSGSSSPRNLTAFGGRMYFTAEVDEFGRELWVTDGTAESTQLVFDIAPGSAASEPDRLTVVGHQLFFAALFPGLGTELWRTDGTTEGTRLVKDIADRRGSSNPTALFPFGDLLLFGADDGENGREVWRSDGTYDGTWMVADLEPGLGGTHPEFGGIAGGFALFRGYRSATGIEVFTTDGTEAGTGLVRDLRPGKDGSLPTDFLPVGQNSVWFVASGSGGPDVWRGNVEGADRITSRLFVDAPASLAIASGRVLFAADDGDHGVELWTVDPGATAQQIGDGCASSPVAHRLSAGDPILGRSLRISGRDGVDGAVTILACSVLPAAPLDLAGTPCTLYLDPGSLIPIAFPRPVGSRWRVDLPLPADPAFAGILGVLQVASGPSTVPGGLELSNGVILRFATR